MKYDVIVIGAGAAGLMATWQAAQRGLKTLLIEHTGKIGEKIRISGGGRCNFTNLFASPNNYISKNPHFCKSALAGYTQNDFIKLIEEHKIAYHEKTLGQLFCDGSATQIIDMFINLCLQNNAEIKTNLSVNSISKDTNFKLETSDGIYECSSLIIATGGLSIPKMGASDFGYRVAKQFGHSIVPTRPALVPLLLEGKQKEDFCSLSGISNSSVASYGKTKFPENILFTHKGLSGPAILQISSYLENFDEEIIIDLLPSLDLKTEFLNAKNSKILPSSFIKQYFPARLLDTLLKRHCEGAHGATVAISGVLNKNLSELKKETILKFADNINAHKFKIAGSEGYLKAEVTAGGVSTDEISSKTMESKKVAGLYFVGEVVDVTGWLGGYNFQWAWSSGYAAGKGC